jgi:hypothetical protein
MKESLEAALEQAKAKGYIHENEACVGSEEHYNCFESMISGRDMHNKDTPPTDKFKRMFPAQVIKDAAMAFKVKNLMLEDSGDN